MKESIFIKKFQEILSHCFGVIIGNMEEYGLNDPTKFSELIFHDITNGKNVVVFDTDCFNKELEYIARMEKRNEFPKFTIK